MLLHVRISNKAKNHKD